MPILTSPILRWASNPRPCWSESSALPLGHGCSFSFLCSKGNLSHQEYCMLRIFVLFFVEGKMRSIEMLACLLSENDQ